MRPRVVLVLAAAGMGGCGSSTLDAGDTERAIRSGVAQQFGVAVREVSCPDDVAPEEGGRFTCTVRAADGSHGKAIVTQEDEDGHVRVRTPFLRVAGVERVVAKGLEEQTGARRVRLRCPDIVAVDVGGAFTCRARAGRRRARVKVVQQDAKGRVRWELVPR